MPTIQIKNIELHYEKFGTNGIPIVFVHGFLASSVMWQEYYIPHLSDSYCVYALDMRGHGQSHHIKCGCNVIQLADDVYQFVQQLKLNKVIYIGMSMGGAVGIQLAINHPNILNALILMNTGFGSPLSKSSRLITLLARLMAQRRWLLKMFIKNVFTKPPNNKMIQAFLNDAILVSKDTWTEYVHHTNKIKHYDLLSKFEAPALVLIGGKDHVSSLDQQNDLVEIIPNAQKIIFNDEGHAMFMENPEAIFKEMMLFLKQNSM